MQPFLFDFKTLLVSLFFFLSTCSLSESVSVTANGSEPTTQLFIPKGQSEKSSHAVPAKLNLVLLEDGKIYAYDNSNLPDGKACIIGELSALIQQKKKNYKEEEFSVAIKPTSKTNYQTTVGVLDVLTQNKVSTYRIDDLSNAEWSKLNLTDNKK